MMSDVDLPAAHVRSQVVGAIDVVVHLARLRDGRRVAWEIASIEGVDEAGEPVVVPVFRFRSRTSESDGHVVTGSRPTIATSLAERGEPTDGLFLAGRDV